MFGHLALFVCCFNFMDFAESTWVDNSAEYKNDRTLRRDVENREEVVDQRKTASALVSHTQNSWLRQRNSQAVNALTITDGINIRNYWMRSTIRARKTLDMHKMMNKDHDQGSGMGNLLLDYDPLKDREYAAKDQKILQSGKSRHKREVDDPPTLTIVKPVLDREGMTRTTTINRPLRSQNDVPLQTSERRHRTSYSKWSGWLKCSATDCKRAGKQIRTRSCFADSIKATDYEKCSYENLVESRACKPFFCMEESAESIIRWSEWSKCSVTCGLGGHQTRRKLCFKHDQNGASMPIKCSGMNFQRRICHYSISCPLWDSWSPWSSCTRTCGPDGVAHRSRECVVKRYITYHNAGTPGSQFDAESNRQASVQRPNVVNKNAAVTTGHMRTSRPGDVPIGMEYRTMDGSRIFVVDAPFTKQSSSQQPLPKFHGDNPLTENVDIISCLKNGGSSEEERKCTQQNCPAVWTEWATWSSCTESCGMGISRRQRSCEGTTTGSSAFCIGKMFAYRRCYTPPCWSAWSHWTDCSGQCGSANGMKKRSRRCSGRTFIIPQYTKCEGEANQVSKCQTESCPGERWGNWGQFGNCNVSCGGGYSNRSRICLTSRCSGPDQDFKTCNDHSCPLWSQWTLFSCCSVTCGVGTKRRSRICLDGDSETAGCSGDSIDRRICYKPQCNVPQKTSVLTGLECGIGSTANLKIRARLRIFGGTKSSAHEWPWQLSWQHRESSSSEWLHFCGATLIHPRWVVTASHCTEESDYVVNHRDPGDNWSIVAGMVKLYKDGTRYFADRIFIHPKYEYKAVTKNDIALIKLRRMVPLTDTVMPACMPRKRRPQPGSECYVTGWGYTSAAPGASLSSSLREAAVPILKFGECRNLGDYYRYFLDSSIHMCAGNPVSASSDSCTGDSGGPLVCQRNKRWYIGAVTSFGFDDCGTPGHVGIYAPMDTYETWIRATLDFHTYEKC